MAAAAVDFPLCRPRTKPDITPTRSVCRQLFGPVDHDQLRSDLKRELRKLEEQQNRRWNFDFADETPLAGPLCWQRVVASKESSSECTQNTCEAASVRSACCSSGGISSSSSRVDDDATNTVCKRRAVTRKRSSTGKMTDYLRQKKQCPSSSAEEKPSRTSSRRTSLRQAKLDSFVTKQPLGGDQS